MGFGNFNFKKPEFKKISDVIWDIDKNFKQGMRVPARIFSSQKLLAGMDLQVYDQVTNVATLPGIIRNAFCMPDGHSGYGFPIGGVAAMDIENGGVISPGGIGFDINCIGGEARILTKSGTEKMENLESLSENVYTLNKDKLELIQPLAFMKFKKPRAFFVKTELGNKIIATGDHPFLTAGGMKELRKIKLGEPVQVLDEDSNKLLFDKIDKVKEIKFNNYVYDFNIPKTHNFIANNFVVSNCGMRLVTTNLTYEQVKPHLRELVDNLFRAVPAGVGSEGFVKFTKQQFREAVELGSEWCVENGYGWKEDFGAHRRKWENERRRLVQVLKQSD